MDKKSTIIVILMVIVFTLGICVMAYPVVNGFLTDFEIQREAQSFLTWADGNKSLLDKLNQENAEDVIPEETEPERHVELWRDMKSYNEEIFIAAQAGLDSKSAYERPAFILADYGLESEIFGVIGIPKLELKMPIYLGATYRHMADGAALGYLGEYNCAIVIEESRRLLEQLQKKRARNRNERKEKAVCS